MDFLTLGFTMAENIAGWVVTIGLIFILACYFENPHRDRNKRK
jgi:hypothetical protein